MQRECFQECFQGIQALEKFQSPATRRVGVSEIGCNTKPLQTVRARTPVPSASFASPLRRQEFLISFKGYYTLCLLSGNTRDSLSLYLFLTRTSRRKSEKEFLSILSFFFFMFFTSIETRFVRFEEEILKCRNTKRERKGERSETLTDNTSNLRRRQLNVIEGTSTENNYEGRS